MKILVAVKTCHRLDYFVDDCTQDYVELKGWRHPIQQERVDAQRETWLSALPEGVDYKFFYGSILRNKKQNQRTPDKYELRQPEADEVFLPCGDNYTSNTAKVKAIFKWALDAGYDYVCLVDDDTFVFPEKLFATDFAKYSYSGAPTETFHPGSCVFVDRKAMEIFIAARPASYADDLALGFAMEKANIKPHSIVTIHHGFGDSYRFDPRLAEEAEFAAAHSCNPEVMRRLWTHRQNALTVNVPLPQNENFVSPVSTTENAIGTTINPVLENSDVKNSEISAPNVES